MSKIFLYQKIFILHNKRKNQIKDFIVPLTIILILIY